MNADKIKTVVIIGGGIMGQGIAQSFAQAGLNVRVVDLDDARLEECAGQIDNNLRQFGEYSLLDEDRNTVKSRISYHLMGDLIKVCGGADFIIEAVPESIELKKNIFSQLDACSPDVILATNTSSFTVGSLAEGLSNPQRLIGVHYFNPAHIMPLVEIHYAPATSEEVISATMAFIAKTGKQPVLIRKPVPGFVVNRIQAAMGREILHLLNEGVVTSEDMDTIARASYGFRYACIGSVEAMDMVGIDTITAVCKYLYRFIADNKEIVPLLSEMVRNGDLGVKSGKGFYDYSHTTRAQVLEEQNRKLLQQLSLFKKMNPGKNEYLRRTI